MVPMIASFAELHRREFTETWAPQRDLLLRDWLEALHFFLCRTAVQNGNGKPPANGRSVKRILLAFFSDGTRSTAEGYAEAWQRQWIPRDPDWYGFTMRGNRLLSALREVRGLNKHHREMVLDVLRFIHGIPGMNLVKHSISSFHRGGMKAHYRELQEIRRVDPRSASSYLGDLLMLYGIKANDSGGNVTTQPVDQWVRLVSSALGFIHPNDSDVSARTKILRECASAGVPSSEFFAGARYLGAHSPRIARMLLQLGT